MRSNFLALLACLAALGGCASDTKQVQRSEGVTFYPSPPAPPRIQHLKTFASEADLAAKGSSEFARFIVGDAGPGAQLQQPYGVAMYDGKLYVADSKGPGLMVFDLANNRVDVIAGTGSGRMKRPINITIDSDGTKYVTDTGRDQVLVFDKNDRFVTAFGSGEQFRPVAAAIGGDRLYVADIRHHQVQVLDKRSGKLLFKFGKAGSKEGELFHPTNLAVGPDGDLYVVETSNFRVQRFSPDGKPVRTYGSVGTAPGQFTRPKGIALDRAGRLYVGDSAFENVQIFDSRGKLLLHFGQPGERAQALNLPTGVAIDYTHLDYFRPYADPNFALEYVVFVVSQFGPNKVDVFGFGRMNGMSYVADADLAADASTQRPSKQGR